VSGSGGCSWGSNDTNAVVASATEPWTPAATEARMAAPVEVVSTLVGTRIGYPVTSALI
jgi:hypothetical protein